MAAPRAVRRRVDVAAHGRRKAPQGGEEARGVDGARAVVGDRREAEERPGARSRRRRRADPWINDDKAAHDH